MVGIDLLEIERLEEALERHPRLASRLFSEDELAYAAARARPGRHLAARFCAKEAVSKALGVTVRPREIEVVAGEAGPLVRLSGETAARADDRGVRVTISVTHSRDLAAASALAVADRPRREPNVAEHLP